MIPVICHAQITALQSHFSDPIPHTRLCLLPGRQRLQAYRWMQLASNKSHGDKNEAWV